jgi:hypothetical protein
VSAPAPLRLRPLEIGDILDETFRIYRRHFWLFAGISVILAIPSAALTAFVYGLLANFLQLANTNQTPDATGLVTALLVYVVGYLFLLLLAPFTYGTVIYAVCESALGHPVTIWGALGGVVRRYFAILGYVALIALMWVVGFCLFPLVIWVQVGWSVVLPVMFIERAGLGGAMSRSWHLVQGRWWRTFLILFLVGLLYTVVQVSLAGFLGLANGLLTIVVSQYIALAIGQGASILVSSLAIPVLQIAIVLVYFDLRVRKEALDLFQLAQRVSAAQPA